MRFGFNVSVGIAATVFNEPAVSRSFFSSFHSLVPRHDHSPFATFLPFITFIPCFPTFPPLIFNSHFFYPAPLIFLPCSLFPLLGLPFFIDFILPTSLWPRSRFFSGVKAAGAYDNLTTSIRRLSIYSGKLSPLDRSRACPRIYRDCLTFTFAQSIFFALLFTFLLFLFPLAPLFALYLFVTHAFHLLSSAFSHFFPSRPPHSFCFTFQPFASCVSQLRTNNF